MTPPHPGGAGGKTASPENPACARSNPPLMRGRQSKPVPGTAEPFQVVSAISGRASQLVPHSYIPCQEHSRNILPFERVPRRGERQWLPWHFAPAREYCNSLRELKRADARHGDVTLQCRVNVRAGEPR